MSFFSRALEVFRNCFPAWLATSTNCVVHTGDERAAACTSSKKEEEVKRSLTKDERLQVLKRALAEEFFCSGHPPFEVTGHNLMECGCPDGAHGTLVVSESGQLYYPA